MQLFPVKKTHDPIDSSWAPELPRPRLPRQERSTEGASWACPPILGLLAVTGSATPIGD